MYHCIVSIGKVSLERSFPLVPPDRHKFENEVSKITRVIKDKEKLIVSFSKLTGINIVGKSSLPSVHVQVHPNICDLEWIKKNTFCWL